MSRAGIGDKLHVHRRYVSLHNYAGPSWNERPGNEKRVVLSKSIERVLRISFARKLSSTIASRERAQKFSDPSRAISELARFIPFRFEYLGRGDEALFDRDQKEKKKEKREIFISACPRTTGNEYTGAKFCLHDLNFHSFDEMRADCKFFCEPLLRTKGRHG